MRQIVLFDPFKHAMVILGIFQAFECLKSMKFMNDAGSNYSLGYLPRICAKLELLPTSRGEKRKK